jgi:hypothetical protein
MGTFDETGTIVVTSGGFSCNLVLPSVVVHQGPGEIFMEVVGETLSKKALKRVVGNVSEMFSGSILVIQDDVHPFILLCDYIGVPHMFNGYHATLDKDSLVRHLMDDPSRYLFSKRMMYNGYREKTYDVHCQGTTFLLNHFRWKTAVVMVERLSSRHTISFNQTTGVLMSEDVRLSCEVHAFLFVMGESMMKGEHVVIGDILELVMRLFDRMGILVEIFESCGLELGVDMVETKKKYRSIGLRITL